MGVPRTLRCIDQRVLDRPPVRELDMDSGPRASHPVRPQRHAFPIVVVTQGLLLGVVLGEDESAARVAS